MTVSLLAVAHQVSLLNLFKKVESICFSSKCAGKDFIVIEGVMSSIGACIDWAKPASDYASAKYNSSITQPRESMTGFKLAESGKSSSKTGPC